MMPAEVAYLSGLTEKEVNKAVDENILPAFYVYRKKLTGYRLYAPLAAVLMSFNRAAQDVFSKKTRVEILQVFTDRLLSSPSSERMVTMELFPDAQALRVSTDLFEISFEKHMNFVRERLEHLREAESVVVTDPDIMGGVPVFKGSRVPIDIVIASIDEGTSFEALKEDYGFLTIELIEDARIYVKTHPRRGRPKIYSVPKPAEGKAVRRVIASTKIGK
ncbi:DUF433 domain-containing protein [Pseudomonas sp. 10B1]|uniref:DUF433 domain-containing protein n=2 Tax=Pseudomonas TaxID=286 RepID=UPI002B23E81C|nr:DUF433 domain-containing protein [Pseudomonas sp. AB12(2023)]MEB0219863.1 DUF433 domain-containing protein [Pseudomonas sp. AB12(2023)]MEB0309997.1 DUF433 domain-containing protein [Pseudomonas sp. 10B1]